MSPNQDLAAHYTTDKKKGPVSLIRILRIPRIYIFEMEIQYLTPQPDKYRLDVLSMCCISVPALSLYLNKAHGDQILACVPVHHIQIVSVFYYCDNIITKAIYCRESLFGFTVQIGSMMVEQRQQIERLELKSCLHTLFFSLFFLRVWLLFSCCKET